MQQKLERDFIHFVLGPAYMEDDVRSQTNKTGFCNRHMRAMYKEQNRLGLALMLHTHLRQLCNDTEKIITGRKPIPLFGKDPAATLPKLKEHLAKTEASCYVCNRTNDTFARYIETFFHIWQKGGDDAKLVEAQEGYCLPCFIIILEGAEKNLSRGKREKFLDIVLPQWQKFVKELEGDLEWFVQKFDHRFANEPWKNSKDALPRTMNFLGGVEHE